MPSCEKKCSLCGLTKPIESYHRQSKSPDGRTSWCRLCVRIYHRLRARGFRLRKPPPSAEVLAARRERKRVTDKQSWDRRRQRPEWKERRRVKERQRYHGDPAYRAYKQAQARESYWRHKLEAAKAALESAHSERAGEDRPFGG